MSMRFVRASKKQVDANHPAAVKDPPIHTYMHATLGETRPVTDGTDAYSNDHPHSHHLYLCSAL